MSCSSLLMAITRIFFFPVFFFRSTSLVPLTAQALSRRTPMTWMRPSANSPTSTAPGTRRSLTTVLTASASGFISTSILKGSSFNASS